jgi:hypothetical protein
LAEAVVMAQLGSIRTEEMMNSFINNFRVLMADKNVHGLALLNSRDLY